MTVDGSQPTADLTGATTSALVNAAQANTTNPGTPTVPTAPVSGAVTIPSIQITTPSYIPSTTAPTTPATQTPENLAEIAHKMAEYELRTRNLMSEKDRALEEARKVKELMDNMQSQQQAILTGASEAAQKALERVALLEQQVENERAKALRAERLAEHPELKHYAAFVPASTDVEVINKAIEQIKLAREQDLATATQQQSATSSQPQFTTSRTSQIVPPANPSRPQAIPTSAKTLEETLQAALTESFDKNDFSIYERAMQQAISQVNAQNS